MENFFEKIVETGRLQGHDKIEGPPLVKGSPCENEACPSLMMGINRIRRI
jgi:hypothetical protein